MTGPIAEMEGYFKWLDEYFSLVPQHLLDSNGGSTICYISGLLDPTKLADEEETVHRRVTDLCWKLNLATQYAFIGDFVSALKCIDMAKDELEFHVNSAEMKPSESHINAYKYAIKTSTLTIISELMKKHGLSYANIEIEAGKMSNRWNELNEDNKSKAVVFYLKACLASSIRLPNEVVLDNLKQAVALEPDFHGWYRYLYRKLRQVRRNSPNIHMAPSDEEVDACKKAYSLRPDLGDNSANMANMMEEVLSFSKKKLSVEQIALQVNSLVNLLKDSIDLSEDHWAQVRLAEIYGYGHYNLDAKQGEKLFQECIKLWPSKSMVWHKAGKFYHLGGYPRGCGPLRDLEKASEYYQRALQLSPCNFPCLMDYLKLLKTHDKITSAIDEYVPHVKKEYEFSKLILIKGVLLWIHNVGEADRLRACDAWVDIIDRFPDSADEVASSIRKKYMEIVGAFELNIDEVIETLEKLTVTNNVSIYKLITALGKHERADTMLDINKEMECLKVEKLASDEDANAPKCEQEVTNTAPVVPPMVATSSGYIPRGRGRGLTKVTK